VHQRHDRVYFLKPDVSLGNSRHSVDQFVSLMEETGSNFSCNLIFIDGSHEYNDALIDIIQMRRLANKRFNRIIVDDITLYDDVRRAVEDADDHGLLRVLDEVTTAETMCIRTHKVEEPLSEAGTYEFRNAPPEDCGSLSKPNSDMYDTVVVGEYVTR
jgi:hypothetical protein